MNAPHALAVFLAAVLLDVTWAHYTLAIAAKNPVRSSLWAVGITFCGLVNVDAYIQSRWYVVPAALGAAAGTFLALRRKNGDAGS